MLAHKTRLTKANAKQITSRQILTLKSHDVILHTHQRQEKSKRYWLATKFQTPLEPI